MPTHSIPLAPDSLDGKARIAGSVGFIGKITGVVHVFATTGFAQQISRTLLNLPNDQVASDEMVNDTLGELANMVAGQLKLLLADHGVPCVLTIPSILRGSRFAIEAVSTAIRRVVCFRCGDQETLIAEIMIKRSEASD